MVIRKLGFSLLAVCGLTLTACPGDDGGGEDTNVTLTATMTATDSSDAGTDAGTDSGMETSADSTGDPGTGSATAGGISHAADMQPIWDANCVDDCHEPGGNWSFVDMSGDAYGVLVLGEGTPTQTAAAGMELIEPESKEDSYLWHKINGTHIDVGGSGVQMPANPDLTAGPPLDQATIDLIGEWIDAGAPE